MPVAHAWPPQLADQAKEKGERTGNGRLLMLTVVIATKVNNLRVGMVVAGHGGGSA
jgi:hypothetical protein